MTDAPTSRRTNRDDRSTMLDLWRPPRGAGEPIGCLSSTYTFSANLFDEQCLGGFLDIEAEPQRESLAFLLERERRLGATYVGVLVDATEAGVPHSLRWDVLPVRIPRGKQHAKLTLLAWSNHIRLVIASANLTEPGYRSNFEVAAPIEFSADACDAALLADAVAFLRALVGFVRGGADLPETRRATAFLRRVENHTAAWKNTTRGGHVRSKLACSLPGRADTARSALAEFLAACRSRGTLPSEIRVASPFFDDEPAPNRAADAVCRQMARGVTGTVQLCVPGDDAAGKGRTLLRAPRAVYDTFVAAGVDLRVNMVPAGDDGERRPWHAKMIHAESDDYVALMSGSSNFTVAGLGLGPARNAEANLVTIIDNLAHLREKGLLRAVWEPMRPVTQPDRATWQRATEDEEEGTGLPVPPGFLAATFHAGDDRSIALRLDPDELPPSWTVTAVGGSPNEELVLSADTWRGSGCDRNAVAVWRHPSPPEQLRVDWEDRHAFLPLNVADVMKLPEPSKVQEMTADAMLAVIAAVDPGAALRAWASRHQPPDSSIDDDLDAATPVDLDPLSSYRLDDTFLHRVRRRAHVMAELKRFIARPAASEQTLDWRLRGFIGIRPLAERFLAEFESAGSGLDPREALLTLADLLIVLSEVRYEPAENAISRQRFRERYGAFLQELAGHLDTRVAPRLTDAAREVAAFWSSVVARCRT